MLERCLYGLRLGSEFQVLAGAGSLRVVPGDAKGEVTLQAADATHIPVYAAGVRGRDALIVGFALLGVSIEAA